jgi:hypothetical protein
LISQLLVKDPTKRLGANEGATELKRHEFFKKVDWDKVAQRKTKPVFTFQMLGDKLPKPVCLDPDNPGASILISEDMKEEDLSGLFKDFEFDFNVDTTSEEQKSSDQKSPFHISNSSDSKKATESRTSEDSQTPN